MTESRIKYVSHPYPSEISMARRDHAHITGQPLVERPWWYEDIKTGKAFHDLYACLGWPSEVSDRDTGMPGYAAIIGIQRESKSVEEIDTRDAKFVVLDEVEDDDVPTLLKGCVALRQRWGYGVQPNLLKMWYGDPERFLQTLALFNERIGDHRALMVAPPDDFYSPKVFDNYVRSLHSAVKRGSVRLQFSEIRAPQIKSRIYAFMRDDPAILAVGGLVHTLLARCMWMDDVQGTVFNVEEAV